VTDPATDDVFGIPETALARGGAIPVRSPQKATPLSVVVKRYHRNVLFSNAGPGMPSAGADQGVGKGVAMQEIPPITVDDRIDTTAALVEIRGDGKPLGTWLASNAIESPQAFSYGGRNYELSLRFQRNYLPYSLTLEKFRHDVYPGTDIPKNFSSLVRLKNPGTGEDRNVLIFMNQPLRYDGKAFYQASFGKNDTLSILQVVSNPGWLLPYVSTVLVTLGLLVHFAISLRRGIRRAGAAAAPGRVAQEA
jgi:ResB-like family protein